MAKIRDSKPARITVACNACRSRKQKCSGNKPVCGQCLENNRPCDWPEQLRRGPAKGHVEALEHRLQVTEGVLLRLLSQVSDTQLLNAFPKNGSTSRDGGMNYIPLARIDRRGIGDWSQFPLDTAQNIRDWQHISIGQSPVGSGPLPSEAQADQSPTDTGICEQDTGLKRKHSDSTGNEARDTFLGRNCLSMVSSGVADPCQRNQEQPLHPPVVTRPHLDKYWLSFEAATKKAQMEGKDDLSRSLNLGMDAPIEPELIPPGQNSTWEGAPSFNFQQQFLW